MTGTYTRHRLMLQTVSTLPSFQFIFSFFCFYEFQTIIWLFKTVYIYYIQDEVWKCTYIVKWLNHTNMHDFTYHSLWRKAFKSFLEWFEGIQYTENHYGTVLYRNIIANIDIHLRSSIRRTKKVTLKFCIKNTPKAWWLHAFNASTQKAEAGWSLWVWG